MWVFKTHLANFSFRVEGQDYYCKNDKTWSTRNGELAKKVIKKYGDMLKLVESPQVKPEKIIVADKPIVNDKPSNKHITTEKNI